MPRAPDWLLGFGFSARDRGLNRYLDAVQKKLSAVEEGFSAVEQSAKELRGRRSDLQRFSEAVKGMEIPELPQVWGNPKDPLDPEAVERSVRRISKDLERVAHVIEEVRKEAEREGLKLSEDLDDVFERIRGDAEEAEYSLDDFVRSLKKIPTLSPRVVREVQKLSEAFRKGRISVETLAERISELRKVTGKAVEDSEPLRRSLRRLSEATEDPEDRFDNLREAVLDWMEPLSPDEIRQNIATSVAALSKLIGKAPSFFKRARDKIIKYLDPVERSLERLYIFDPEEKRRVRAVAESLQRKMGGVFQRLFRRRPGAQAFKGVFEGLFGTKRERSRFLRDIDKLYKSLGEPLPEPEMPHEGIIPTEVLERRMELAAKRIERGYAEISGRVKKGSRKITEEIEREDWGRLLGEGMERAIGKIPEVVYAITSKIRDIIPVFSKAGYDAGTAMSVALQEQMDRLSEEMASKVLAVRTRVLQEFFGNLQAEVKDRLGGIIGILERFGENVRDLSQGVLRRGMAEAEEGLEELSRKIALVFSDILAAKGEFVEKFVGNFRALPGKVGGSLEQLSRVGTQEFGELESVMTAPLARITEELANTSAASRRLASELQDVSSSFAEVAKGLGRIPSSAERVREAFRSMSRSLSRMTPRIVDNLEWIADALKKATGQNPVPLAAIAARLVPALGRAGAVAGRIAPSLARLEPAVTRTPKAVTPRRFPRRMFVEIKEEKLLEEVEDRIERLAEFIRARRWREKEEGESKGGGKTLGNPEPVPSIIDAINSMSAKISGQLAHLQKAMARPPAAAKPEITGTLEVDSDELMRAFSVSVETKRGLRGMAR